MNKTKQALEKARQAHVEELLSRNLEKLSQPEATWLACELINDALSEHKEGLHVVQDHWEIAEWPGY